MMHEMYEADNIDTVFIGTSHCYRSIDTKICEDRFGQDCFNLGTAFQQLDGTYALLKEADKNHDLDRAFVELTFAVTGDTYKERRELTATYIVSDYLKPSINKYSLIFGSGDKEAWINGLSTGRRNHHRIFEKDYVKNVLSSKINTDYFQYPHVDTGGEYYSYKGFVASREETPPTGFEYSGDIVGMKSPVFSEDDIKYIDKIIEYCQSNNIELHFIGIPMSDYYLGAIGNYDDFIEATNELLSVYGYNYIDFNLLKEQYFSGDYQYFRDLNHLNQKGAEVFTPVFCDYYNNVLDDNIFYSSYEEKIGGQND